MSKPNGYWTKEKCNEEALKHKTRSEFKKNSSGAYTSALKNDWIEEICKHMPLGHNPNGYWTKERCAEKAKFFLQKKDFQKFFSAAYKSTLRNGWSEEICSHMIKSGNRSKRCIYAVEFSDNHAYIGLTYSIENRFAQHLREIKSSVYNHIKKTNIVPTIKKLTDYIDVNEASKLEELKKEEYLKSGWLILNKAKCGVTGGTKVKWTKEKCTEEALKYNTKREFLEKNNSAYNISYRNGWFNEICKHMINQHKRFTKEECTKEALKYKTKAEFDKHSNGAYQHACKNGYIGEICKHMTYKHNKWTKEECIIEMSKYKTKAEFIKGSNGAYQSAYRNGYLNEILKIRF